MGGMTIWSSGYGTGDWAILDPVWSFRRQLHSVYSSGSGAS